MDRLKLPSSAFIDPHGNNRAEIDALAQEVLDLVLSHATDAFSRSPLPEKADLPAMVAIPEMPVPKERLIESLRMIVAGSMNAAHPGYIGHMDTMPTTMPLFCIRQGLRDIRKAQYPRTATSLTRFFHGNWTLQSLNTFYTTVTHPQHRPHLRTPQPHCWACHSFMLQGHTQYC